MIHGYIGREGKIGTRGNVDGVRRAVVRADVAAQIGRCEIRDGGVLVCVLPDILVYIVLRAVDAEDLEDIWDRS